MKTKLNLLGAAAIAMAGTFSAAADGAPLSPYTSTPDCAESAFQNVFGAGTKITRTPESNNVGAMLSLKNAMQGGEIGRTSGTVIFGENGMVQSITVQTDRTDNGNMAAADIDYKDAVPSVGLLITSVPQSPLFNISTQKMVKNLDAFMRQCSGPAVS